VQVLVSWYDSRESCFLSSLVNLAADPIFKVLAAGKFNRERHQHPTNEEENPN
jgi:hypothetical protein